MATTRSQGTTLKFTPEGGEQLTVGRLTSVGEIAPEAEEVDVTTLESTGGYREYMQGFRDSGEVEISGYHDAADACIACASSMEGAKISSVYSSSARYSCPSAWAKRALPLSRQHSRLPAV